MLVRESISFERKSDPYSSTGIGTKQLIEKWLDEYFINVSNATKQSHYRINDDFTIDVFGFFATKWKENLPDYINFNIIYNNPTAKSKGDFSIFNTKLNSLRGFPKKVSGNFLISDTNIKNLIGGPKIVKGDYLCSLNPHLSSLEGLARKIGGNLACNNKHNLSEEDIPKGTRIDGNISIDHWAQW